MAIKQSKIILGLPQLPIGVPDELFDQFKSIYFAMQNLADSVSKYVGVDELDSTLWDQLIVDDTVFPSTPGRWYPKQAEALSFGQLVSPILSGGILQAQLANATNNTRWACGIVTSSDHQSVIGQRCEVSLGTALITGITGLIVGGRYWLNTVNGQVVAAAPIAAGNIEQFVGWAIDANRLVMHISGEFVQH